MPRQSSLYQISEIEISYRNKVKASDRPKLSSSRETYLLLLDVWEQNKLELVEQCNLLLLDRGNACLGISRLTTGGIKNCLVDVRIAFATALKARATGIILAHNHPSGLLKSSRDDRAMTDKLSAAGRLLDIPLLDHLIVTRDGYLSFADQGLISHGSCNAPILA